MTLIKPDHNFEISIPLEKEVLFGNLFVPTDANGIILFAHGSGSSRFSTRNRYVADKLNKEGLATLLFDLLTKGEDEIDVITSQYRFDIALLAKRLIGATDWLLQQPELKNYTIGYFGSSTGAAAALIAAAQRNREIKAVVSRGGRPDLASEFLQQVVAPTLLIVGGLDDDVIKLNQEAQDKLTCASIKELVIVEGATHLFEEHGKLDEVVNLTCNWFTQYLTKI